jgi:cation/acetate symporter
MNSSRIDFIRFAALSMVVVGLTAGTVAVADRLGAPGRALGMAAVGIALGLGVVAGLASGTMRLPAFLTQGRSLPAAGASLATAIVWPWAFPGQSAVAAAAGLVLAAFLLAPALRRSGAPTWASFIGARFASRVARALAAVVVGAASFGLGTAALAVAAGVVARVFDLGAPQSAAIVAVALACTMLPGGARGQTRAAVALGLAALGAAAMLWYGRPASSPERFAAALSPLLAPDGLALGVSAMLAPLALPAFQTIWPGIERTEDCRIALLWAAVLTGTLAYAVGPVGTPAEGLFPAIAADVFTVSAATAAAGAFLLAAAQALAFDLGFRAERRRTPASARFARIRLACLAVVALAGVAAGLAPGAAAAQAGAATAVLVGALLPPVLLGVGWDRANAAGAIAALCAGLATSLALVGGRLGPDALGDAAAGLCACAMGLAAGAAASLFTRRSTQVPRPLHDDML